MPCEINNKLLTAIWLELRKDGLEAEVTGKELALARFRTRFTKATREREPAVYFEILPSMEKLRINHPDAYYRNFIDGHLPVKIQGEDVA